MKGHTSKKCAFAFLLSLLLAVQMTLPAGCLEAIAQSVVGEGAASELVATSADAALDAQSPDDPTAQLEDPAAEKPEPSAAELEVSDEAPSQAGTDLKQEAAADPQPAGRAATLSLGGFTLTGDDLQASDFTLASNVLTINTNKPFSISGSSTTVGIQVPAGVDAHVTLAGLTLSAPWGFNILKGGAAHFIIADNTTNSITSTNDYAPGIHCGTGSTLTIDDAVPNVDLADNLIVPQKGQIPSGVQYRDATGTVRTSTGDYLTRLDSPNRGTLKVKGAGKGAAIGGAYREDGGSMTFNGGRLEITNGSGPTANVSVAHGAGVGGGGSAAGTSPSEWITINGGWITSNAAFHGAGFGGGWNTTVDNNYTPATVSSHPGGTGNIRINGGYIESNGGQDGNGFGRGCYGGRTYCDNRDYTILITGGTMIPHGGTNLGEWGNDIGGAGTNPSSSGYTDPNLAATVIVSGGSVYVSKSGERYRFDGIAYGSYTEDASGKITAIKDKQVVPITIDLSADLKELTPPGQTVDLDRTITEWKLMVKGEEIGYGAPGRFDKGKLYLWLSPDQAAEQVTVQLSYQGNDGSSVPVEPLYRPAGTDQNQTNLKRYVFFDLQEDFFNQPGGKTGEASVAYNALSTYEQGKFGDTKDENGLVQVPVVKKDYDGLPYSVRELTQSSPINSGGDDKKDIWTGLSYLSQLYDAKTGKLGAEQTVTTTPADTGLIRFTLTSTQYASADGFKESYYGHRAYGWFEISPVAAVLTMDAAPQWGNLSDDGKTWTPVTQENADTAEAGNRLKLQFNIRSANTTAATCAAPTGSFQVSIDGQKVGAPIPLTKEGVESSVGSAITWPDVQVPNKEGVDETRHSTQVTYYFDPTNNDALLKALEDASKGGEHTINIEYLADKNYILGADANPENAKEDDTFIVPVPPATDVKPDPKEDPNVDIEDVDPDPTDPDDPDKPDPSDPDNPGGDPTKPDIPADKGTKVVHKAVTLRYSEYAAKNLGLTFESTSSMPMTCTTANGAVADLVKNEDGGVLDATGKVNLKINSCGTTRIVMEQPANALYTGTRVILDVHVIPDESLKPQVQIRLVTNNLTHPGEPARPGDEIEYLVTGLNLKKGSAWQTAKLLDTMDPRLELVEDSVSITENYATPEVSTRLDTQQFYAAAAKAGFKWSDFDWEKLAAEEGTGDGQYTFDEAASKVASSVGTVYGGQSVTMRFKARLASGTANRPQNEGDPKDIEPGPGGEGTWGVKENPAPGEPVKTPTTLDPTKPEDIQVIGDGAKSDPDNPDDPNDPNNPDNPKYDPNPTDDPGVIPPLPIIPKDPVVDPGPNDPDAEPDIKVDKAAQNLTRPEAKHAMVGDKISYTITLSNQGKDTAWYSPVIRDTLPQGLEFVPGTLKLAGVDGTTTDVSDAVYVEKTRTIALYTDDLYGGESVSLTFQCQVTPEAQGTEGTNVAFSFGQTPSDRWKEEHPDPDKPDPDDPNNPDKPDPSDPDSPGGDPDNPGTDPDNPGGDNPDKPDPSDPDKPDPSDPDNPGGDPESPDNPNPKPRPKPGDPFVPDPPAGTDPDDPDYDPWDGFDWDGYPKNTPSPKPSDPTPTGTEPGIIPGDPADEGLAMALTGDNLTRDISHTMVGDTIRYTATFTNTQDHTQLYDTVLRNLVPQGLDLVPGSIHVEVPNIATPATFRLRLAAPVSGGATFSAAEAAQALRQAPLAAQSDDFVVIEDGVDAEKPAPSQDAYLTFPVADEVYNAQTRTIGVHSGHMPAGTSVRLVYDAVVGPDAAGKTIVDHAWGHGYKPSSYDVDGEDPVIGKTFEPEGGLETFLAQEGLATLPARHEIPVSEIIDPEDVVLSKTAQNLTTTSGETYVGDKILYTLTLTNRTAGSVVFDALFEDTLPVGLTLDESTVTLKTAAGRSLKCSGVYDTSSRRLAVVAGDIAGGSSATLTFEATVNEQALSADVGNVARAFGTMPSQLPDEGHASLTPGTRFDPPVGWDAFLASEEGHLIVTSGDPIYPSPQAGVANYTKVVVLPARGSIMPKTGDMASLAPLLSLLGAASVTLTAVVRRKRF